MLNHYSYLSDIDQNFSLIIRVLLILLMTGYIDNREKAYYLQHDIDKIVVYTT